MTDQPLAEDEDAGRTLRDDEVVQGVINRLAPRYEGAPMPEIEVALQEALVAAGLGEQPEPWVHSTAGEIAAGRIVVADGRAQVLPEDLPER
ncbi:MAG: hypothetical protein ABIV05_05160 [Actinomycetota bacterium]